MFTCNGVCIETTSKSKHVQLIHLGNLLQKLFAVWPKSCVQHGLPSAQLEMEDSLKEITKMSAQKHKKWQYFKLLLIF